MKDGITEEVPCGARKRHRHYRVRGDEELRQLVGALPPVTHGGGKASAALPDRFARIESEISSIDGEACTQNLDLDARQALRQERAQPVLEALHQDIETARTQAFPAPACRGPGRP